MTRKSNTIKHALLIPLLTLGINSHAISEEEPELEFDLDFAEGMGIENDFPSGNCSGNGALDYVEIRMLVSQQQSAFQEIYQRFSEQQPGYGGQIEFELTVLPSGDVGSATLLRGQHLPFAPQIINHLRTIKFPACTLAAQFKHTLSFGPVIDFTHVQAQQVCLTREEILQVMDNNHASIYSIYSEALKHEPELAGEAEFNVYVFPSGRTEAVTIEKGEAFSFINELKQFLESVEYPSCNAASAFNLPIHFLTSEPNTEFEWTTRQ